MMGVVIDGDGSLVARRLRPWVWVILIDALLAFGSGLALLIAGYSSRWASFGIGLPLTAVAIALLHTSRRRG